MRIGETLAITRDNINLKENTITIEKTLTRNKDAKVRMALLGFLKMLSRAIRDNFILWLL